MERVACDVSKNGIGPISNNIKTPRKRQPLLLAVFKVI